MLYVLTSADDAEASRGRRWRAEVAGPGPATCAVVLRGVEKRPPGRRLLSSASHPRRLALHLGADVERCRVAAEERKGKLPFGWG